MKLQADTTSPDYLHSKHQQQQQPPATAKPRASQRTRTCTENSSAGNGPNEYYQWPVLFAVLPPLLSLYYGGKVEEWNEAFLLLIIAFYLYAIIKGFIIFLN
jgi:hypothetical protein